MDGVIQVLDRARRGNDVRAHAVGSNMPIVYTETRIIPVGRDVLRRQRVFLGDETDPAVTAYKMLRTQVLQKLRANNWNTLAVTSPGAAEGKTLTAVNLAVILAQEVNQTVLLVDMDMRRPSVHRCFEYEPPAGLSDYASGDVPLKSILFNPGVPRLVVLPGGQPLSHSSEVLSSPEVVALVDEIATRYPSRIVIFDLPPVLAADDALAFAPHVDSFLLVAEEGKTRRDDLARAMKLLSGSQLMGVVLNKSEDRVPTY